MPSARGERWPRINAPATPRRPASRLARFASPLLVLLLCGTIPGRAGAGSALRQIFVLRHAEKSSTPPEDPALSDAGRARALELARMLEKSGVTRLYATSTRRARETLDPLSERTRVTVMTGDIDNPMAMAQRVLQDSAAVAVVVAHGDTVEPIVNALVGSSSVVLGPVHYDDLFLITLPPVGKPTLVRMKYGAEEAPSPPMWGKIPSIAR